MRNTHPWNEGSNAIVVGEGLCTDEVVSALKASGAQVYQALHADLENEQAVKRLFDSAESDLAEKITILVFSDAIAKKEKADKLTLADWHHITIANMDLRFFCCQELARRCLEDKRKGVILHLVSGAALNGGQDISAAVTSAGGIETLNMSLAVEWARDNIRSNIIATHLLDSCDRNADADRLSSLGNLVAYYCSDYASYITGSCVGVDEIII